MKKIKRFFRSIGPGFITGSSDDDPSGIATYSIAGAQLGYKASWLSLFLIPMMISIQEMCGRIGMVSGRGLAGVIKKHYSKKLLFFFVGLLTIANTVNISADLSIMAACLEILTGINYYFLLMAVTVSIVLLEIFVSYKRYSNALKWLGLILLVYAGTAFLSHPNWLEVIKYTLIPHIDFNSIYILTLVGFVGTTISPYLFFWQASEEVEEEIEDDKVRDFSLRPAVSFYQVKTMRQDTIIGMVYSSIIAFFIVVTTASTLFANGINVISSPQEAALALKPLAGHFAFLLFSVGIIGIGFQSIPVLAGSVAYALSETLGWREGLNKKLKQAKGFYGILALSVVIGALLNVVKVNPIQALFYSAVLNGLVSVPLIAIIIKMADDEKVVGKYKTRKYYKVVGIITFFFVLISSVILLASLVLK